MAKPPAKSVSPWLVSTEWLASRLRSPDLIPVDGSFYLPAHKRDAAADRRDLRQDRRDLRQDRRDLRQDRK